jgi:hypothetical protein
MNTVQNGKGDRPRNNWGADWYAGYDAIDWRQELTKQEQETPPGRKTANANPKISHEPLESH